MVHMGFWARCLPIPLIAVNLAGQQSPTDVQINAADRAAFIENLATKIQSGYILPDRADVATRSLRSEQARGAYDRLTAKALAEKLTSELRAATHDMHIAVYFEPQPTTSRTTPPSAQLQPRERFNYGFYKLERLQGNVGYLDLRSFPNLDEARQTASTYLDALAGFDAIILDLRQNGGGNTPMVGYVASYFFGPKPVHITDMEWRDEKRTIELWTSESVSGRRSETKELFILIGPSTFSAAEDLAYSLRQLKRAILVGETTRGGAHMGRGIQRLSPLFTAFIPTGRSLNPVTKTNWENVGVEPDVRVPVDKALNEAHILALRGLLGREQDPSWQSNFRRMIDELTSAK